MTLTYNDGEALKQLVIDAGLTWGSTIHAARSIGIVYADEKHAKPREWHTLGATLHKLLEARQLPFSVMQSNPHDCEFPMLIFTPHERTVKHG